MFRRINTRKNLNHRRACGLRSLLTVAALGALGGGLAPAARAAGFVYQQHTLNAGVLVVTSDPSPYVFYVLNNRPDVRPTDVKFVNPLAPVTINVAMLNRYPSAYTVNQTVTPDMAAYWEVPLNSVSDSELSQYNVLYLRADNITFGPATNEKLRRFVENGGQLIVEYGTSTTSVTTGQGLFTGTDPATTSTPSNLLPPTAGAAFLQHPILSQPYFFTPADILNLGLFGNSLTGTAESSNWFSPALKNTTGSVVTAAQMGAGQVVVSALNIGANVGPGNGAYFLAQATPATVPPTPAPIPFYSNFLNAPAADLKLLTNILSWAQTHPNENKTSHGNASSAGLSSFSPAWQFPVPATNAPTAPPAPAVWGNFVFAVDASGSLSAFDAYPSENLLGGTAASGQEPGGVSQYPAKSYDQIWTERVGTGASAPTVAAFGGTNYVFVEKNNGSVLALNAVTGAAGLTLAPPANPTTAFSGNAPAPTYYDGRLYAGQPDGTLHVYDLNEGTSVSVPLNATPPAAGSPPEVVTGPPSVGLITSGDSNVLAALVPTNYNLYTVLLGARNEPLIQFTTNGAIAGYSIARSQRYGASGSGDLANIFADLNALPMLNAYDLNGLIAAGVTANSTAPNPQDPLFSITGSNAYFTDWNMDFPASTFAGANTPPNPVNLYFISATSYNALRNGTPNAASALSAPATDRHGDYYYTETQTVGTGAAGVTNSYLIGVSSGLLRTNVHLKFRFLLPHKGDSFSDADKVDYTDLEDFQFKGAPVVDDQGNVYAAATRTLANGVTQATVLCLRANQQISAIVVPPPGTPVDLTQYTITQAPEDGGATADNGITANSTIGSRNFGQFTPIPPVLDASGTVVIAPSTLLFFDFGRHDQGAKQIAGSLTEPKPLLATDSATGNVVQLSMHTNMAWYAKSFNTAGNVTGLTQVGNSLLLTDGAGLYRISTKPLIGANRQVTAAPFVTPLGVGTVGVGAVGAPPSVGGNVLVVSGASGIAARTRQVTVIADSRRILGVDGDGGAAWAVDATTRTDTASNVSTKVPFSHPTSLSQFEINDYLVADTGNNRCVRFDSAGNVQWELTRFADPSGLLGTGQPMTLSQPSSVVVRIVPDTTPTTPGGATLANPGGSFVYYLVADTGNDRIVEVADEVNRNGGLALDTNGVAKVNHVLNWASHTGDRDGRSYRYGSAAYYKNLTTPSGISIAATVTNTRLGPVTAGGLGPISGDAAGGSIVVFNYPMNPTAFSAITPATPNDLVYTTAGFYAQATANGPYTPFTIRNPRFLQLFTSPTASAPANPNPNNIPAFDFLYADDNGAFDLSYDATRKAFIATPDRLQFTQSVSAIANSNYQNMSYQVPGPPVTNLPVPAFGVGVVSRTNLPFVPTCVQGLGTDSQPSPGVIATATTTTRRYLITQSYAQGELGTPTPTGAAGKLGGEVFEVDVNTASGVSTVTTPGGFAGNATLSHPDLTGPLTQPTFAVRLP